jgi:wobble nucleotide-excising tRNase
VKNRDLRLTEVGRLIPEELSTSHRYNPRSYNRVTVAQLLDGPRSVLKGASDNVESDLALVKAPAMKVLPEPSASDIAEAATAEPVKDLLGTHVVAQTIAELVGHGDRSRWVQEGIVLHSMLESCLFCGQALSPERVDLLKAHFDDAVTRLQQSIDNEVSTLRNSAAVARRFASQFPVAAELYPDLSEDFTRVRAEYHEQLDAYDQVVETLIGLLHAKRDNPFHNPIWPESLTLEPPPARDDMMRLLERHNSRARNHKSQVNQAAKKVELARVKACADQYDNANSEISKLDGRISTLDAEIHALTTRIVELENAGKNPLLKAKQLTTDVARILGRDELTFTANADGKSYTLTRSGTAARDLSEGERTAIALLHFLANVGPDGERSDAPIVVFDDPVSSLDHGILYGISAAIWAATVPRKHVAQVFVLTHNFELFREWLARGIHMPRPAKRKAAPSLTNADFSFQELRARVNENRSGDRVRAPSLEPWKIDHKDGSSTRLLSQYHFWFYRVAKALIATSEGTPGLADRMELFALAPNAARKMLEGFLAFRVPKHIGNFHQQMENACADLEPSLRHHVERYLHAFSHNEEGDISTMLDPDEADVVLRAVFQMINTLEPDHFRSMCDALELDSTKLLGQPKEVL